MTKSFLMDFRLIRRTHRTLHQGDSYFVSQGFIIFLNRHEDDTTPQRPLACHSKTLKVLENICTQQLKACTRSICILMSMQRTLSVEPSEKISFC